MDMLKKFFPYSFGADSVKALVIKIIILLVVGAVVGFVIGLLAGIPIIGKLIALVGTLVDLYVLAAIAVLVLDYTKVLK